MSTRCNDTETSLFSAEVGSYLVSDGFDLFHRVEEQFLCGLPAEKADEE